VTEFTSTPTSWLYVRALPSFVNLHEGGLYASTCKAGPTTTTAARASTGPPTTSALAQVLDEKDYHDRFVFGEDQHGGIHGAVDFPDALKWLWARLRIACDGGAREPRPWRRVPSTGVG
jgi:hypothetical protein